MKAFTQLVTAIDQTNKTNEKIDALADFFTHAGDDDKIWVLGILSGRPPKRFVKTNQLKEWAAEAAGIPQWLFEESYHVVGDLSETISSIIPAVQSVHTLTLAQWISGLQQLEHKSDAEKKEFITRAWLGFDKEERFVFNKLFSGNFRMGVSQKLVVKALAKVSGQTENSISHRLMGSWLPDHTSYEELILAENTRDELSRPYPFYLAYAIEGQPEELGDPAAWFAEHKLDGIRSQLIFREQQLFIWTRGEDLVTDKFPELGLLLNRVPPGTVIDGELIGYSNGILPFSKLQTRIGRKNLTAAILRDVSIVVFAYDLLEFNGRDIRHLPLFERRELLEKLVKELQQPALKLSETLTFDSWQQLALIRTTSRDVNSEGIMLKRKDSEYGVGRKKGDWWKWKIDPWSIDAVMIYAQSGHGRRANLFTDYTFAVWSEDGKLLPFAKAYSGLTDQEILEVDAWVKKNTIEKFGPVRSVKPEMVFEIGFEGISRSTRHKSGVALRFPRILRWRKDKKPGEADTLENLRKLL